MLDISTYHSFYEAWAFGSEKGNDLAKGTGQIKYRTRNRVNYLDTLVKSYLSPPCFRLSFPVDPLQDSKAGLLATAFPQSHTVFWNTMGA